MAEAGLDIEKMIESVQNRAQAQSIGNCSWAVAKAINDALTSGPKLVVVDRKVGGLGPSNGGKMGPQLKKVGFESVKTVSGTEFDASFALVKGDVVVIRTVDKTATEGTPAEKPGHVAIWTGEVWVSDFKQPGGKNPNVYRSSKSTKVSGYEIFRYTPPE